MRRKGKTEAEKKEIKNLIDSIKNRVLQYDISLYELGKENSINMTGAGITKIMNGVTKKPNVGVLKEIDNYLIKEYETEKLPIVAEESEQYGKLDNADMKELIKFLKNLDDKIDKIALKQDINFELLKSAKLAELNVLTQKTKDKISS